MNSSMIPITNARWLIPALISPTLWLISQAPVTAQSSASAIIVAATNTVDHSTSPVQPQFVYKIVAPADMAAYTPPYRGLTLTPHLMVIETYDRPAQRYVAYDRETGAELWSKADSADKQADMRTNWELIGTSRTVDPGTDEVAVFQHTVSSYAFETRTSTLEGVEARAGKVIWQYCLVASSRDVGTTPAAVFGNVVAITYSAHEPGSGTLGNSTAGEAYVKFLDAFTGKSVDLSTNVGKSALRTAALQSRSTLGFQNRSNPYYMIHLDTGDVTSLPLPGDPNPCRVSGSVAEGNTMLAFVAADDGGVGHSQWPNYIFAMNTRGHRIWQFPSKLILPAESSPLPKASDSYESLGQMVAVPEAGVVMVTGLRRELYGIQISTGKLLWQGHAGAMNVKAAGVYGDGAFLLVHPDGTAIPSNNTLAYVEAETGRIHWFLEMPTMQQVAVDSGNLFAVIGSDRVNCYSCSQLLNDIHVKNKRATSSSAWPHLPAKSPRPRTIRGARRGSRGEHDPWTTKNMPRRAIVHDKDYSLALRMWKLGKPKGYRDESGDSHQANLRRAQRLQAKGDLTGARNAAIRAWLGAGIAHSIPVTTGSLLPVILFPERDALHFFAWNTATEVAYVDLSGKTVKLAWRATLKPFAANPASTGSPAPFAFLREEALVHEDGVRPKISAPLVYFEVEYISFGGLIYGRVTQSGDFVSLGKNALTWHHYDGSNVGGVTYFGGRWVAWPTVISIPGERNGIAGLQHQAPGPVAVSSAAAALARQANEFMAKGDLTAARNAAIAAWTKANIAGSIAGVGPDSLVELLLFPEGEALRFFDFNKDRRITYIEIRGDSVALMWAADVGSSERRFVTTPKDEKLVPWPTNLMPRIPEKFAGGATLTREVGRRPGFNGAFVFFTAEPAVGGMGLGRVAADGSLKVLGGVQWPGGTMPHPLQVAPIPGERAVAPGAQTDNGK